MRTLVVGDIHGCYAELMRLLDLAGLSSGDRLISIGDAVDRGPASPEVIELLRTAPNATWLMGNHERKHVRSFRGQTRAARSLVPLDPDTQLARGQPDAMLDRGSCFAWL